ncbi:Telomerase protein component 1 [Friedmanniomyces endolithicus]|uniref:phosphatidylinositol-3,4,5-trisphosphate 3-phosphatase n=1 Tax=Friedmanniomyces endolithicus TaxID=329885 RepID=A0AAN6L1W3_9PEZI|nr:Telomerase protein component 1 [Friedmanniomyces endolithicus]KAK1010614.1 Telomerase protein component 1 [Friedmanniomyces endolithicus]KAK1037191.1 Telomerase protein component 1 [Friedmanniomyces endolithicus]
MASLLRHLVSSPRLPSPDTPLDLSYITPTLIATSGPSSTYPRTLYRNPLPDLLRFLNTKHGSQWAIWEFRAEGTGYADEEVEGGRVHHFPWPDHHPPPFGLVPEIVGSMRGWLSGEEGRVAVVHCKAGKGRSGTVVCSYLISEEGWSREAAEARFTERRMRAGFGRGVSIPSQRRTIGYVERWARGEKRYREGRGEVLEVHVWGLRSGVRVAVEGFAEEGRRIETVHTFGTAERKVVSGVVRSESGFADAASEGVGREKKGDSDSSNTPSLMNGTVNQEQNGIGSKTLSGTGDVVFRPSTRVILPTNDINIDFERRSKSKYGGFTMLSSVAHVWFNTFFEGRGPEQGGRADDSGVFEMEWEGMDGIKGSSRKGTRAFDRMAVVWRVVEEVEEEVGGVVGEAAEGGEAQQIIYAHETTLAEPRGRDEERELGLRVPDDASVGVSRASSTENLASHDRVPEEIEGVKSFIPRGSHKERSA